jgi:hypothetical protein
MVIAYLLRADIWFRLQFFFLQVDALRTQPLLFSSKENFRLVATLCKVTQLD